MNKDRKRGQSGIFPAPPGGKEKPFEAVDECPEIPDHLVLHWDCFTQCLGSSDGGRIEIGHVLDYCELYHIESELARDELLRLCRCLSDEFQQIRAQRIEQQTRRAQAQTRSGQRQPWRKGVPRGRKG